MIHFADVLGNHCIILSGTVIHELITNYTKIYKRRKEKKQRNKEKKKPESGRKWGWDSEKKKKTRDGEKKKETIVRDFSDKYK